MKIKNFKKILEILEQNGHDEEDLQVDHDIIYILSKDKFDTLPQDVQTALCGGADESAHILYGAGYDEGMGCFISSEEDALFCFV
jgi:hypothetical protein